MHICAKSEAREWFLEAADCLPPADRPAVLAFGLSSLFVDECIVTCAGKGTPMSRCDRYDRVAATELWCNQGKGTG